MSDYTAKLSDTCRIEYSSCDTFVIATDCEGEEHTAHFCGSLLEAARDLREVEYALAAALPNLEDEADYRRITDYLLAENSFAFPSVADKPTIDIGRICKPLFSEAYESGFLSDDNTDADNCLAIEAYLIARYLEAAPPAKLAAAVNETRQIMQADANESSR